MGVKVLSPTMKSPIRNKGNKVEQIFLTFAHEQIKTPQLLPKSSETPLYKGEKNR